MNLSDAEKKAVVSAEAQLPDDFVFGLDIGTRSIVGTVGYRQPDGHFVVVAQAAVQHETRAMLDGQIHDIGKVADTIRSVSDQLEQLTGKKLNCCCRSCIKDSRAGSGSYLYDRDCCDDRTCVFA